MLRARLWQIEAIGPRIIIILGRNGPSVVRAPARHKVCVWVPHCRWDGSPGVARHRFQLTLLALGSRRLSSDVFARWVSTLGLQWTRCNNSGGKRYLSWTRCNNSGVKVSLMSEPLRRRRQRRASPATVSLDDDADTLSRTPAVEAARHRTAIGRKKARAAVRPIVAVG